MVQPEKIVAENETATDEPMDVNQTNDGEKMEVDESSKEETSSEEEDEEYLPVGKSKAPELFNQEELNDLIRDLGLPKDGAEYLASALKKSIFCQKEQKYLFIEIEKKSSESFLQTMKKIHWCIVQISRD